MNENPYSPPTSSPKDAPFWSLPKGERKRLILEGKTSAGLLVVMIHKYPIGSAVIGTIVTLAFLAGCWNIIQ